TRAWSVCWRRCRRRRAGGRRGRTRTPPVRRQPTSKRKGRYPQGRRGSLLQPRRAPPDQLGGPPPHGAGLGGDAAERLLGQLDSLAEPLLGLRPALLEPRLRAQPLQSGLAALDQLVVQLGHLVAV